MFPIVLAQSVQDITFEMQRLQRNYEFLSYGLIAAWLIIAVYVMSMVTRQRKLKGEIERLRAMLQK